MFFLIILKLTVSASFWWIIWPHLYCSHALPFSIGRNTCILYLHIHVFTFIYTCLWLTGPNAGPGAELCFWDIPGMFEWQRSLGQHQGKILSTILTSKISSDMLVSMWVSVWVSMYYHAPNNLVSLYCLCLIWIISYHKCRTFICYLGCQSGWKWTLVEFWSFISLFTLLSVLPGLCFKGGISGPSDNWGN